MSRRILRTKIGQEVKYFDKTYIVTDVYPYIAYLTDPATKTTICVCLGDLVMSGLEQSMVSYYPKYK